MALALSGCMEEDFSECLVDNNLTLTFSLTGTNGQDQFDTHIDMVDVVIFDAQGRYLMHHPVSKRMLGEFKGVTMTITPGTYYVVCWANVLDNSRLCRFVPGITSLEECSIEIVPSSTTGDQVYYAPYKDKPAAYLSISDPLSRSLGTEYELYKIDVPVGSKVTKDMAFVRAHRTIHVYTKNLTIAPQVSVKQLWSKYNFFFETQSLCYDFARIATSEQISGTEYHVTRFHSALGEITSNVNVDILSSIGNKLLYRVNMLQFVTENPPADTDEIHILVEFLEDLGVNISVPEWVSKPVTPGVH